MKTLTENLKSKISSYIDHELDSKEEYKIKKLIQTDNEAKSFYQEMTQFKSLISIKPSLSVSKNFTNRLFEKIEKLDSKKERLSIFKRFIDSLTIQKLSYAGVSVLFAAFFGFAIINIAQPKLSNNPASTMVRSEQGNETAPAAETGANTGTQTASANATPQPKALFRFNERNPQQDEESAADTDNNQRVTRKLFDNLERQNGRSGNATANVQFNLNQGVENYYKRNFVSSRQHFMVVLQNARKNSVQYLQAQDYLKRIPQR